MNKLNNVKGIIFDYGGTIDTNGYHWANVLWNKYVESHVPVDNESFRQAYVYGERTLALRPLIKPEHDFYDVLFIKVGLQIDWLIENGYLGDIEVQEQKYKKKIAQSCYEYVLNILRITRPVLEKLSMQYNLVLVSNFYGNIHEILKKFSLLCFFKEIIESSIVGVRKPDPAIFELGIKALELHPQEVVVIGDSFSKDMLPAQKAGCRTVWLKGKGWENEVADEFLPDEVIASLEDLPALFEPIK